MDDAAKAIRGVRVLTEVRTVLFDFTKTANAHSV